MTDFAMISATAHDPFAGVLAGLQLEFDGAADAQMARAIVALEELDFFWDARVAARWVGTLERFEEAASDQQLWLVMGCLDGRWFVAKAIVGGDGRACDLIEVRRFEDAWDAYEAFDL